MSLDDSSICTNKEDSLQYKVIRMNSMTDSHVSLVGRAVLN